jgi:hypothetical protein
MIRKQTIVYLVFTAFLLYIISPWFFAKKLLFNEFLSLTGLMILGYKRFRTGSDPITQSMIVLILWGIIHAIVSLFRMDTFYYYLRNLVIVYSMVAFFVGYYCMPYLGGYVNRIRRFLKWYIGIFIFIRLPRYLFERFGMATLFPALFRNARNKWLPLTLIVLNLIYAVTYDSFTAFALAAFFMFLFLSPGYRFFMQVLTIGFVLFAIVFAYLQPNLSLISHHYSYYSQRAIYEVIRSHPLLSIDGNSTWRLVLWKQIIVDHFPVNIFGMGFGTPILKYFPVEDFSKISTLPYVLGAHNSFVYLFGRLGIIYVILIANIYLNVFQEYFYYKAYYFANNNLLIFLSFFALTFIALFNPALESPIYASGYWLVLGFTARSIAERKNKSFSI